MRLFLLLALIAASGPGETGVLEIRSLPEVEVVWEGTALGRTDDDGTMRIAGIPAGDYAVTLRKSGFRETTTRIVAGAGEKTVLVLHPEPVSEPPALRELISWEARSTEPARPVASEGADPAAGTSGDAVPGETVPGETAPPAVAPAGAAAPAQSSSAEARVPSGPAAADPPERDRRPAAGGPSRDWLWLLAALGLLAAWLIARRRPAPARERDEDQRQAADHAWVTAGASSRPVQASVVPSSAMAQKGPPPEMTDAAFLDELKRRERKLEPGEEDDVIDVEFVEVRPAGPKP